MGKKNRDKDRKRQIDKVETKKNDAFQGEKLRKTAGGEGTSDLYKETCRKNAELARNVNEGQTRAFRRGFSNGGQQTKKREKKGNSGDLLNMPE